MKIVVTILEENAEEAVRAIRALRLPHDLVEVRTERFASLDLAALRSATPKPMLLTHRSEASGARPSAPRPPVAEILAAGIDLVDVEWSEDVQIDAPSRTVLSHHDFEGVNDVEAVVASMLARGCAHTKIAATPQSFANNERLLKLLRNDDASSLTVIGMGERGLYARILAPFIGSELAFVAGAKPAAPGQLTLEQAVEIYAGPLPEHPRVFAVVGNPAGHSRSPMIHNALFRKKRVAGVYTIASVAAFAEVIEPFLEGEVCGLSVTAPFKQDALAFASKQKAVIGGNARDARAVNTLVNVDGRIFADNTDVDGFAAILPKAQRAAIIGAGATARAAQVALDRAGVPNDLFNRTPSELVNSLDALAAFDGDLVINTLPGEAGIAIPRCRIYVEAAYAGPPRSVEADRRINGLELLQAQAVRQHQIFMKVFDGV